MKLKKIAKVLMSCVLAGALFTGCGGSQGGDKDAKAPEGSGSIKLGMITCLNASEKKMEEILAKVTEESGIKLSKHVITYYDSLKTMQMGIESGSVDVISTYNCVGKYIISANDKYAVVSDSAKLKLADAFCFAVRKDDTQLKADLDKALNEMKSDGTLDKLVDEYITNVKADNIPKVDIPKIDGAQTIKVGITGDLPPMDLILADNSPAGFNTAMLAEISKRLNRNVEIVQIESGARAAALNANQIDVVFWAIVPANENVPNDIDKPEGLEFSEPYFKDDVTHLKYNK